MGILDYDWPRGPQIRSLGELENDRLRLLWATRSMRDPANGDLKDILDKTDYAAACLEYDLEQVDLRILRCKA